MSPRTDGVDGLDRTGRMGRIIAECLGAVVIYTEVLAPVAPHTAHGSAQYALSGDGVFDRLLAPARRAARAHGCTGRSGARALLAALFARGARARARRARAQGPSRAPLRGRHRFRRAH